MLHGSKNKDNVSNFSFFRINEDNSLDISFEEWRDYLLFHPSSDLADIINHWRNHTVSRHIVCSQLNGYYLTRKVIEIIIEL